jgi:D-glycero-alpha-D-manno-heptose-7-phosphate kinase
MINQKGSVRVDLLGGTLDLNPINLILPNVVTLNLATSLCADVTLEKIDDDIIEIISKDYNSHNVFKKSEFTKENICGEHFGKLSFLIQILDVFKVHGGLKITLQSGSPAGAGLGGSSAMGVTFYAALCKYLNKELHREEAIKIVNSIEGRILDSGPAGYQDYYPALYGGVLGLVPSAGYVEVNQLYSSDLKTYLEKHITLVFSGEQRLSGINNWEVYKAFFDKEVHVREGLEEIARLSHEAYLSIKDSNYDNLISLIAKEGAKRKELFPGIVTNSMETVLNKIQESFPNAGLKACGAGGGGCFLITHGENDSDKVKSIIEEFGMTVLDFIVEEPL